MKVTIAFESGPIEMARLMKHLTITPTMVQQEVTEEEAEVYEQTKITPEVITAEIIIGIVARHFMTSSDEMKSKSRDRYICEARFTAMRLIKEYITGLALKQIGGYFGNRDHSSVIHAINTHSDLCKGSWDFAKKYKKIREELEIILKS